MVGEEDLVYLHNRPTQQREIIFSVTGNYVIVYADNMSYL